ncbi:hypothetical protein GGF32_006736 [Allomyces javanicus]|nr:hypothetical protein GGF32_006736 [Allomyces javanicus]
MAQRAAHAAQAAATHRQVAPALPAHDLAPPVNNDPHDPVVAAIANQVAATLAGAAKDPPMHDDDMHDDRAGKGAHDDEMEGGDNENNSAPRFDPHAPRDRRQHKWTAEEPQEVIRMYFEQNLSVKQIVQLLLVGNNRKVQEEHIKFLMGEVIENVALTLDELLQRLYDQYDVDVTKETIARYLREEKFVLKRLTHEFLKHHTFHDVLYLDESGFNLHLHRGFGRAPRGEHAVQVVTTQSGHNTGEAAGAAEGGAGAGAV